MTNATVNNTIGKLQLESLLAEMSRRDGFTLKRFHDDFLALGRLPVSLLRWEMTGTTPEHVWKTQRLDTVE